MKEACCRIRLKKRYIDNRIEAVQADAGCFLTTLKRCFGVLRLPLGQPGDFPRIFGLRAQESQTVQKSAAEPVEHAVGSVCAAVFAKARAGLPQSGEPGIATKTPGQPTNSSGHQFLCAGIGVWSTPDAV